jgi:Na+/phosphate symporter
MKERSYFFNPFRLISPKLDSETQRLEKLHEVPVSESHTPEEGMLVMVSKLIEMTRILSKLFVTEDPERLEICERLAQEVHQQEKLATTGLAEASPSIGQNLFKIVVRFPSRLQRMGDMFQRIVECCRIKKREGIPFSDKAQGEISAIFTFLEQIMVNLRDALAIRNQVVLQHVKVDVDRLGEMIEDARFAHWDRLEAGFCAPQASSIFLEILDSCKFVNEYINKMWLSLSALAQDERGESPS